jgi:hypothetical protein
VLLLLLCVVSAYAAWDNVLSDNADVRLDAEAKACTQKKCDEKHGLTKAERTPFGQSFEYTWRDGTVHVWCRRTGWLVGARACVVE